MFRGRSVEAKRRLCAALSRELAAFGVTGDTVKVLIHDVDRENWGLVGVSFADRDPGSRSTFELGCGALLFRRQNRFDTTPRHP